MDENTAEEIRGQVPSSGDGAGGSSYNFKGLHYGNTKNITVGEGCMITNTLTSA